MQSRLVRFVSGLDDSKKILIMILICLFIAMGIQYILLFRDSKRFKSSNVDCTAYMRKFKCFCLILTVVILELILSIFINITSSIMYDLSKARGESKNSDVGRYIKKTENNTDSDERNKILPGWGNSSEPRSIYTLDEINDGALGDTITFNSILDSTIGDERAFVGIRENTGKNEGAQNVWTNSIFVEDGKEYIVRLYAHNNNPNGINAIYRDTTIHFKMPLESGKQLLLQGSIDSSNCLVHN